MISSIETDHQSTQAPEAPVRHRAEEVCSLGHFSASRLKTWTTCRLKYFFAYVLEISKPISPAMQIGRAMHGILQKWNWMRWGGEEIDADSMLSAFDQVWADLQATDRVNWEQIPESDAKHTAWKLAQAYLSETPIPPDERPEGVEVRAEAELPGLPKLVGVIDLVRKGGVIVDFKTTRTTPSESTIEHLNDLQLTAYGLLYREAGGHTPAGMELHHIVKLKTPKVTVHRFPPPSAQSISRFLKTAASMVEGVRDEDFVPSPGLHCSYCEFFQECRKWH